jgi:two-component system, OmpR family, phosphate regulon sensor histidine kinase PhoR
MIKRAVELLLLVTIGGFWGFVADASNWALAGALLGALVWLILDGMRARRVIEWLTRGEAQRAPAMSGLWAELVERNRKLIKKLEKKAQNSDHRLQDFLSAIQASPNGVILLDAQGRIEWANLTAANQLGFDPQRDVGQYVRNLVRQPEFIQYLKKNKFDREVQIDSPGMRAGQASQISVQIHPYDKKRKLMLSRDVTAVRLAEAMRRDFVANVSHEIRTPLTVLSGFVETMQTVPLDDSDRQRYLGLMSQQAQRMQTLVSDLLTLSRLEGSPAPGLGEWMPLQELSSHVMQEARGLSQAIAQPVHQLELLGDVDAWVSGSKSELLSAMSNLLSNAVRYTPPGGRIEAGWQINADGSATFTVNDTGPGIAPEHLPRLTERFYRVDRSRSRETGGTGLGLAIVKHVVQRHGGQVDVQSQAGAGSTFQIVLPAARVRVRVAS